ncbi:MAG TPA: glycosyltransferase [Candidatus Limnocylindria bacterium]|nr:glycosyltransferase [Candidatus Limnocylindria bacterium]
MTPPRVLVAVHGKSGSIEAVRAHGLTRLHPPDRLAFVYREPSPTETIACWDRTVRQFRPDLVYLLNTAFPGALLAPWWRLISGVPFVLDTGDAVYEMARTSGIGGGWKLPALWAFENLLHRSAAGLVVRGTRHREYLESRGVGPVQVIRDGYLEGPPVSPDALVELRRKWGLTDRFVLGLMGSTVYSPRLKICYGWDLIRALAQLRDAPVMGLIIGDGTGLPWLRAQAEQWGVADRVVFTGRIPYAEVPAYLRLMDVAMSTQTNNLPGQVRTTGKLPEYMAVERFILASRVGEASLILPDSMLLDYHGEVDLGYPARIAERVRLLLRRKDLMDLRHTLPAKARELFSYDVLAREWSAFVGHVAGGVQV